MYCKSFFTILLVLSLVACRKKDAYTGVSVFGHAAAGLHTSVSPYHDNSKEAVEYALSFEGIDGIELDIQISKDSTIWLFHDSELADETNLSGCIHSLTDQELDEGRYSSLEKEKLTKLSDVLGLFSGKSLILDFRDRDECTGAEIDSLTVLKAFSKVNDLFAGVKIGVILNNERWLTTFHSFGWDCFISSTSKTYYFAKPNWSESEGICIRSEDISKEEIAEIKSVGKKVLIFDVRSPKGIRKALKKHPNVLLTDDIKATLIEKYK